MDGDDPIFGEAANFATAFARLLSRSMRRIPHPPSDHTPGHYEVPAQYYLSTEPWRLSDSSKLLFWGIELDKRVINNHTEKLTGLKIADMALPTAIRNYLEKFEDNRYEIIRQRFLEDIKEAASLILTFAQVIDIESCVDLPLRFAPGWMFCTGVTNWEGLEPIDIESDIFLNLVMKMMRKDVANEESIVKSEEGRFLTSHSGWSLFYSSVGDCDPETVNCELLAIKRGVPTNSQTSERKYRIKDAPPVGSNLRTPVLVDKGGSYLPSCVTKVYMRTEQYSSRSNEFWLSIRFGIDELDYTPRYLHGRSNVVDKHVKYSIYSSHYQFHDSLWGTMKTTPCSHPSAARGNLPLDLDTVTAAGLTWANGGGNVDESYRICICLVKGDARARWLIVSGILPNLDHGALTRRVLLRCDGCCEDCAVKAASTVEGTCLVIL